MSIIVLRNVVVDVMNSAGVCTFSLLLPLIRNSPSSVTTVTLSSCVCPSISIPFSPMILNSSDPVSIVTLFRYACDRTSSPIPVSVSSVVIRALFSPRITKSPSFVEITVSSSIVFVSTYSPTPSLSAALIVTRSPPLTSIPPSFVCTVN